jgi:glc operon protein GlcG
VSTPGLIVTLDKESSMKYPMILKWARLGGLLGLVLVAASGVAPRRALAQAERETVSDVRDQAGMFRADVVEKAKSALERIEKQMGFATMIETVDSLRGESIDAVALEHARRSAGHGIFVLIAQKERKIEVLVSRGLMNAVGRTQRLAIREAFAEHFGKGEVNEGLSRGVQEIEKVLAAVKSEPKQQPERVSIVEYPLGLASQSKTSSPLVVRDRIKLTLAGARRIIAAAEAKAEAMGLKMNIAVVDDGGHMIAFERMEGARPASGYTATTKAVTAATFRQPSGPIARDGAPPDPLLNISLQNAASASGGRITSLLGGVPVVVDGQITGAVGVGGGSGEQDAEVARAGIAALLSELKSSPPKGE